jgi:hypothetical protein
MGDSPRMGLLPRGPIDHDRDENFFRRHWPDENWTSIWSTTEISTHVNYCQNNDHFLIAIDCGSGFAVIRLSSAKEELECPLTSEKEKSEAYAVIHAVEDPRADWDRRWMTIARIKKKTTRHGIRVRQSPIGRDGYSAWPADAFSSQRSTNLIEHSSRKRQEYLGNMTWILQARLLFTNDSSASRLQRKLCLIWECAISGHPTGWKARNVGTIQNREYLCRRLIHAIRTKIPSSHQLEPINDDYHRRSWWYKDSVRNTRFISGVASWASLQVTCGSESSLSN